MMTIPWTSANTAGSAALIQVSRLELTRARDVPGFLVAALRVRRATLKAPGAIGVSLRAAPLSRTFWTLSAWTDPEAVAAFVTSDVHIAVMNKYCNRMAGSHFHTWTEAQPTPGHPTWDDALDHYETTVDSST